MENEKDNEDMVRVKFDSDRMSLQVLLSTDYKRLETITDDFEEFLYKYFIAMNYVMAMGLEPSHDLDDSYLSRIFSVTYGLFYENKQGFPEAQLESLRLRMFKEFEKTNPKITILG